MLEVNAVSKGDKRICPKVRWSNALLLTIGALGLASIAPPYSGHAVVRVSTSRRPSSQRMRNSGLQNCIHLLEGHTTAWGLSQDLYKLTSRLRLGTKSLSLELRASHLSWTWNGSTTLQDSQVSHNEWVMAPCIGLHPSN